MEQSFLTFLRASGKRRIPRGAKLFSEGQHLENLYYLDEGYAKIFS